MSAERSINDKDRRVTAVRVYLLNDRMEGMLRINTRRKGKIRVVRREFA